MSNQAFDWGQQMPPQGWATGENTMQKLTDRQIEMLQEAGWQLAVKGEGIPHVKQVIEGLAAVFVRINQIQETTVSPPLNLGAEQASEPLTMPLWQQIASDIDQLLQARYFGATPDQAVNGMAAALMRSLPPSVVLAELDLFLKRAAT